MALKLIASDLKLKILVTYSAAIYILSTSDSVNVCLLLRIWRDLLNKNPVRKRWTILFDHYGTRVISQADWWLCIVPSNIRLICCQSLLFF